MFQYNLDLLGFSFCLFSVHLSKRITERIRRNQLFHAPSAYLGVLNTVLEGSTRQWACSRGLLLTARELNYDPCTPLSPWGEHRELTQYLASDAMQLLSLLFPTFCDD